LYWSSGGGSFREIGARESCGSSCCRSRLRGSPARACRPPAWCTAWSACTPASGERRFPEVRSLSGPTPAACRLLESMFSIIFGRDLGTG
jgi:hypothetical protein